MVGYWGSTGGLQAEDLKNSKSSNSLLGIKRESLQADCQAVLNSTHVSPSIWE